MANRKEVLGIVLGGGQGSRLAPLTSSRSKPAVPIAGKYRLVDIPISNCFHSDIKRVYVLTQFNSASLNSHIKNTFNFSFFSDAFVEILAAEQTPDNSGWFQGTADAVRQCIYHFEKHDFEYALILSGDQLYQMDFNDMLEAHKAKGADISIATIPVKAKEATSFGILKTDDNNFIDSFIEKPGQEVLHEWTSPVSEDMHAQGKDYLASMGIYIFNRKMLVDQLEKYADSIDFGKEIIPKSIESHKVLAYQYEGYWTDIGNIDSFFEANLELTSDVPKFNLYDNENSVLTRARLLPPSKINGTITNRSIISEGSIITAKSIENSVIGIRSRIGKNTVIKNAYIMGNDYYQKPETIEHALKNNMNLLGIGDNCHIEHAIIDKNTYIGNNVTIIGNPNLPYKDTPLYTIKDGIVVVKKDVKIEDNTVIK